MAEEEGPTIEAHQSKKTKPSEKKESAKLEKISEAQVPKRASKSNRVAKQNVTRVPWLSVHLITGLLPGKSHGRSLVGYSPWGLKESDMTERLYLLT